ncbi:MAG: CDP-glycerol glycerophosphotransferase family protein [Anaerovoracaceae bacterium]
MSSKKDDRDAVPTVEMNDRIDEHLISARITDISWERIIMHLTLSVTFKEGYEPSEPLEVYAVTSFMKANAHMEKEENEDGTYTLSLNVTNPGYCMCLPAETYHFIVCSGLDALAVAGITDDLALRLRDCSREFLYSNKNRCYVADFSVSDENDDDLWLVMRILNARKAGLKPYNLPPQSDEKKSSPLLTTGRIRNLIRTYYAHESSKYDKTFNGKIRTILFMTEQNDKLGSNLTSVYDRMCKRGLDKDYEILFSARSSVEYHQSKKSWIELMKKVAKADMIFIDDHCPFLDWLQLSPRTKLIQLWHAGAGFKSSGYSRWGNTGCPAPVSCHRQYDYGISSSTRIAHFHSEVFGINPEQLLPTGMPRMDEYLDPEHREKITKRLRKKFPLINGKKVILFAPTYRGKNKADAHYPYEMIDFGKLYETCGDEYVVLFKMHPWVSDRVPIPEKYKDRMIDVNKYHDINNLFYITDLMITDYSSGIFEYSLMKKPMLFFAFDKIQYAYSRGFHRPYEESAPGRVCSTFDELLDAIRNKDFDYEKVEQYVEYHFDNIDTHASDRVIDWIIKGNIPEEYMKKIEARQADNDRLLSMDFADLQGHFSNQ